MSSWLPLRSFPSIPSPPLLPLRESGSSAATSPPSTCLSPKNLFTKTTAVGTTYSPFFIQIPPLKARRWLKSNEQILCLSTLLGLMQPPTRDHTVRGGNHRTPLLWAQSFSSCTTVSHLARYECSGVSIQCVFHKKTNPQLLCLEELPNHHSKQGMSSGSVKSWRKRDKEKGESETLEKSLPDHLWQPKKHGCILNKYSLGINLGSYVKLLKLMQRN